ncbi:hypothetical protein GCM10023096_70400 [Nonomuraea ferruginea]
MSVPKHVGLGFICGWDALVKRHVLPGQDRGARGGGSSLAGGVGACPHSTQPEPEGAKRPVPRRAAPVPGGAGAKPPHNTSELSRREAPGTAQGHAFTAYGGLSGPSGTRNGAQPEGFPKKIFWFLTLMTGFTPNKTAHRTRQHTEQEPGTPNHIGCAEPGGAPQERHSGRVPVTR